MSNMKSLAEKSYEMSNKKNRAMNGKIDIINFLLYLNVRIFSISWYIIDQLKNILYNCWLPWVIF
jgi:hypothetical protein